MGGALAMERSDRARGYLFVGLFGDQPVGRIVGFDGGEVFDFLFFRVGIGQPAGGAIAFDRAEVKVHFAVQFEFWEIQVKVQAEIKLREFVESGRLLVSCGGAVGLGFRGG